MAHKPVLYIVIPCYNEESVLPITSGMFRDKVRQLADAGKISDESRILFVNDGSKDKTWEIITALSAKDPCFHCAEPQPRAPKGGLGRADGGERPLRHHHQHRLRRAGRYQRHGRDGGCVP